MSKTDRETVFLSVVGMSDENIDKMMDMLKESGFADKYRVIATNKAIQIMDPIEVIQSMENLYGKIDSHSDGIDRWAKVNLSLYYIERSLTSIQKELSIMNANFENIEKYPDSFTRLVSSGFNELSFALENLKAYTPKEGHKW